MVQISCGQKFETSLLIEQRYADFTTELEYTRRIRGSTSIKTTHDSEMEKKAKNCKSLSNANETTNYRLYTTILGGAVIFEKKQERQRKFQNTIARSSCPSNACLLLRKYCTFML